MIEQRTCLYSQLDRDYSRAVSGPYQDLSYRDNDTEVIAAIKNNKITGYWRPAVLLGEKTQEYIEHLWDISRDITMMDYLENGGPSDATKFLLSNGFVDEPFYHQVIDLRRTQEVLWHDVRKSYRPLISKDIGRVVMCKNQAQWGQYMRLHAKVAHRQTRTKDSWQVQWQMIDQREAYAVFLYDEQAVVHVEDSLVAGALFMCNDRWAYYASAKSVDQTNSHALLWKGIELAKQRGCYWMDMGQQVYFGDQKAVNISMFKRGFGGTTQMKLLVHPRDKR